MSRYKLIKPYPGSLEVGTVVFKVVDLRDIESIQYTDDRFSSIRINREDVEDYPEFWQPEEEWINEEDIIGLKAELNKYDFDNLSLYDTCIIVEKYFRMKYKLYERTS